VSTELGTGTSVVNHHGQTGFVVPPGDPHALAQAIKVLLANLDLRHFMGTMGRYRVVNEYTHDLMVERTLDVYREARADV
jgi:rhamnosyl/mannosyltransferase